MDHIKQIFAELTMREIFDRKAVRALEACQKYLSCGNFLVDRVRFLENAKKLTEEALSFHSQYLTEQRRLTDV
jgi:hypothetical protein